MAQLPVDTPMLTTPRLEMAHWYQDHAALMYARARAANPLSYRAVAFQREAAMSAQFARNYLGIKDPE